ASANPWIGYLRESVRNNGASGCGLVPARPTEWHPAQFFISSSLPCFRVASAPCEMAEGGEAIVKANEPTTSSLKDGNRIVRAFSQGRAMTGRRAIGEPPPRCLTAASQKKAPAGQIRRGGARASCAGRDTHTEGSQRVFNSLCRPAVPGLARFRDMRICR